MQGEDPLRVQTAGGLASSLSALQPSGRPIRPRSTVRCRICGRAVGALGRLLWPGAPACVERACEVVQVSSVTELFSTCYGRSLDTWALRVFSRCFDGPSIFVEREVVVSRAGDLAAAHLDLLDWQWAYDAWTLTHHPEAHRLGRTLAIPPRRIEDVVRIRLSGEWARLDPTEGLPTQVREGIRSIREQGPTDVPIPF